MVVRTTTHTKNLLLSAAFHSQIESFAKKHGCRLRHYKDGFVAVFDKDGTTPLLAKKLMLFSNVYDDKQRAEAYATLDFPRTYYLAYRDLPAIIAEHVVGKGGA